MPGGIHPPLDVTGSWPTPNYVNPATRGWENPILNAILYSIALIVVLLRLHARFFLLKSPGIDDYLIAAAMPPLLGLSIALSLASKMYHYDRHVWDIPIDGFVPARKILLAIEILYMVSTGLTKLAVLLFYRRLSAGGVTPRLRRTAQASIAFVAVFTIVYFILPFVSCTPLSSYWNQSDPRWYAANKDGDWKCLNDSDHLLSHGIISIVQDFLACGLPLVLFSKLLLPRKEKILLGGVFFLGFSVCVMGIFRLVAIAPIYHSTYDVTWASHLVWIWTGAEANLGVICASLPCCRIYLKRYLNSTANSSEGAQHPMRQPPCVVIQVPPKSYDGLRGKAGGDVGFEQSALYHVHAFSAHQDTNTTSSYKDSSGMYSSADDEGSETDAGSSHSRQSILVDGDFRWSVIEEGLGERAGREQLVVLS